MPKFLDRLSWYEADSTIKTAIGQDESNGTIKSNSTPYSGSSIPGGTATGIQSVAFGGKRYDKLTDAETTNQEANGNQSFVAGASNVVNGDWSSALGADNKTYLKCAHAEGKGNIAGNSSPNAAYTSAYGQYSDAHAEGVLNVASGYASHAEGGENKASGHYSHAGGFQNTASGDHSTTIGASNTASGKMSFSGGNGSESTGEGAVTFGYGTQATGKYSTALGYGSIAQGNNQFVIGQYNETDSSSLFLIGDGSSSARKNAVKLKKNGTDDYELLIRRPGDSFFGGKESPALTEYDYNILNWNFLVSSYTRVNNIWVPLLTKGAVNTMIVQNAKVSYPPRFDSFTIKASTMTTENGAVITWLRAINVTDFSITSPMVSHGFTVVFLAFANDSFYRLTGQLDWTSNPDIMSSASFITSATKIN